MVIEKKSNILEWKIENIDGIPVRSGVYVIRNFPSPDGIVYVGSAKNLKRRLQEHYISNDIPEANYFDWYKTDSIESAKNIERIWINRYSPKYNERRE